MKVFVYGSLKRGFYHAPGVDITDYAKGMAQRIEELTGQYIPVYEGPRSGLIRHVLHFAERRGFITIKERKDG